MNRRAFLVNLTGAGVAATMPFRPGAESEALGTLLSTGRPDHPDTPSLLLGHGSPSSLFAVPAEGLFKDPDWHLWGGTALPFDGRWYRIFARWRKSTSFNSWVSHSEIACGVGESPIGPWSDIRTILGREETSAWDAHNFHNPAPIFSEGKFWLFYTGNRGNGEFWDHRNHQRIGVAVAEHPFGPWKRFPAPIIEPTPGGWDHLITNCPTVTRGADGVYRMV
jgi:hypothetical protein